jgi:hypothetical protein
MYRNMRSTLLAGSSLWWLVSASTAFAGIVPSSRLSEIWYHTVNLTNGVPPPTQLGGTTDLYLPYAHSFAVAFDHFTVTGAHNTGSLYVFQNSNISSTDVYVDTVQNGITQTDYNSPGLYTRSTFLLEFQVSEAVPITLTGLIVGSSDPAHSDFARVELRRDSGLLFSTTFHAFPYVDTLQPGYTYELAVEATGVAFINGATSSRALASMQVPAPGVCTVIAGWLVVPGLLVRSRRRMGERGR